MIIIICAAYVVVTIITFVILSILFGNQPPDEPSFVYDFDDSIPVVFLSIIWPVTIVFTLFMGLLGLMSHNPLKQLQQKIYDTFHRNTRKK